jgi:hypothetical protein
MAKCYERKAELPLSHIPVDKSGSSRVKHDRIGSVQAVLPAALA